jgi:hypothetical protein
MSDVGKFHQTFVNFTDYTELYSHVEKLLVEEFARPMPMPKLNFFKAYVMCMEVLRDITIKYCAPDGSGIPKEFGHVPQVEHPIHLRNIHSAYQYHSMTTTVVDRMTEIAKKKVNLNDLTCLRVMGQHCCHKYPLDPAL